jgi:UDP-N-acetylglucosamine acyltransferase
MSEPAFIHPTAYVHPTAIIFSNVRIGANCYIGPYCIIGGPPEHADINPHDPPIHGVWIADYVRMYGHNTVDGGMKNYTFVGSRCILMKGAHVGHDANVWNDCTISCGARVGGHCLIESHSNIGLNATLHQFTELAMGTMVGASAFVKGENVLQWRILAGVPARDIGENKVGRARWEK